MVQGVQGVEMLVEIAGCGEDLAPKQGEKHDAAGRSPYPHCSRFGLNHWMGHSGEGLESCLVSSPTMEKVIREKSQKKHMHTYKIFQCPSTNERNSLFFLVFSICTHLTAGVSC